MQEQQDWESQLIVLAATGHTAEARNLLATLNDLVRRGPSIPIHAAFVHIGLGQRSQALDILEGIANSTKVAGLVGVVQGPAIFDQLNAEPRYQKLVARAGK